MNESWLGLYIRGAEGQIDARALSEGAAALVRLLDKSAENLKDKSRKNNTSKWVVRELSIGSLNMEIAPSQATEGVGEKALANVQQGLSSLHEKATMPSGWDRLMLLEIKRLSDVRGMDGVKGLTASGSGLESLNLEEKVLGNVARILSQEVISLGSVTGRVTSWRVANEKDHVEVRDEATSNRVDVIIPNSDVADVGAIIRKRVRITGELHRNLEGEKTSLNARKVDILKSRAFVSIMDVRGAIESDWLDGLDPVEWQRRQRDAG